MIIWSNVSNAIICNRLWGSFSNIDGFFEYLETYFRYGIDPHFPSMRSIINSKYTPVCLALGYLRVLFQEPVIDHVIKKMYCS